jgi:hypothetical protein
MLANIATMLSFVPVLAEYEEFEDTKGVIRICISKKNRQHNDNIIPLHNTICLFKMPLLLQKYL